MSDASSLDEVPPNAVGTENVETGSQSARGEKTEEQGPQSLPLNQVFDVLKNERRRYVLKYLRRTEGQVSLGEVAEQIAAWENDKAVRNISSSERKRVYVGLYQCHLPKMDSMDVVSFNKPRGTIDVGPNADDVYEYIDIAEETRDRPWHVYSVALSLLGAIVLTAAMLLSSVTTLPIVEIAVGLIVATFLSYSLVCLRLIRSNSNDGQ